MTVPANTKKDKFFLRLVEKGKLLVDKEGTIFNTKTNRTIGSPSKTTQYINVGYKYKERKIYTILAHRLVWLAHKGLIPEGFVVNHKDGNKHNNKLSNLEICSESENHKHAFATGLKTYTGKMRELSKKRFTGNKNPNASFDENNVLKIRKDFKNGKVGLKELSAKYDVSVRSVKSMLSGKTYSHVKGFETTFRTKGGRHRK